MMRSSVSALAACVLLLLSPSANSASAVGPRIVVGYTEQGFASAGELERQFDAGLVARIEPLRADVLRLDSSDPQPTLALLRADSRVRYAELDGIVHALRVPNDEYLPTQWSVTKTGAEQAWDLSVGSSQVVVAVLDTGIDSAHADLQGKLVEGYDYVNNDQDPNDDNGHGTAVAGIVAADSDNRIGVAGYCWSCRLMPVKVLGADGTGFASGLAQGIVWATDHGARVLNLSLGGPVEDAMLAAATQYAWRHGVLVVAAAGNEGSLTLDYPAALPNVVSVGASDQNDRLYSFSNSGARVAAPGENSTTARGGGYVSFLGTSSAAPVVSGIAALAFSLVPGATPAQVERALETTAAPIPGVVTGRVDAYGTLHALAPELAPPPAAPASHAGPGRQGGAEQNAGTAVKRRTKVVRGRMGPRKTVKVVFTTGAGRLQATVKVRNARRAAIRLRLITAGRVVALARGKGGATLRAPLRQQTYRLVVSTSSPRSLAYVLTISYPSANA
jgi:subtilisin family serine protease